MLPETSITSRVVSAPISPDPLTWFGCIITPVLEIWSLIWITASGSPLASVAGNVNGNLREFGIIHLRDVDKVR